MTVEHEPASQVWTLLDRLGGVDGSATLSERRKGRLVVGAALSLWVWVALFTVLCLFVFQAPMTAGIIFGGGLAFSAAVAVQRQAGPAIGGQWLTAALAGTILGAAWVNGAGANPFAIAVCVLPVLSIATTGVRSGVLWAMVSSASLVALRMVGERSTELSATNLEAFSTLVALALPFVLVSITALLSLAESDALSEVERRSSTLRTMMDAAPDGILVLDESGEILAANPAASELTGVDLDAMIGREVDAFIGDRAVLAHPSGPAREFELRRADGETLAVEATLARAQSDLGASLIMVVRDIRQRKAMATAIAAARDRALEANNAKSAFLANTSHELRTPLNAIIGYAEILEEEIDEMDGADHLLPDLERILGSSRHLLALIDDVLDLTRIEAGRFELRREEVDLGALIGEITRSMRPTATRKGIELQLGPAEVGTMSCDPTRVRQVLACLVDNAIKFTDEGSVHVRAERDENGVRLFVHDTGIGMSRDFLEAAFERFKQADASSTRIRDGSGLGLSIAEALVDHMGGTIRLESTAGEGTVAVVALPVSEAPVAEDARTAPGKR